MNFFDFLSTGVTLLGLKDKIVNGWDKRKKRKKLSLLTIQNESINYKPLKNWLIAQEWEAANQETKRIILLLKKDIASATILGNWGIEYLFKQHHEHLLHINKLWMDASDNHFGFTSQLETWRDLGGVINWRTYYQLTDCFGWTASQKLKELKYSLNTPKGHLPTLPFSRPFHENRVSLPYCDGLTRGILIKNPPVLYFLKNFESFSNI
ncbi:GUN4 domain-containing protein [Chroococcus sp. FPU101]|uniref:GUN4 domain-containing protein n=1 Tax=Chroococcus sp. FPU101 TaxID=1974212 RepID=UPI001A8FDF8E|nr:GUN4 domain-containing protein [Chroococcus sp. FPU101]GFE69374.1 hypothetical protein CFPU101_19840 [Chroococcus sp. FPU101]